MNHADTFLGQAGRGRKQDMLCDPVKWVQSRYAQSQVLAGRGDQATVYGASRICKASKCTYRPKGWAAEHKVTWNVLIPINQLPPLLRHRLSPPTPLCDFTP